MLDVWSNFSRYILLVDCDTIYTKARESRERLPLAFIAWWLFRCVKLSKSLFEIIIIAASFLVLVGPSHSWPLCCWSQESRQCGLRQQWQSYCSGFLLPVATKQWAAHLDGRTKVNQLLSAVFLFFVGKEKCSFLAGFRFSILQAVKQW